MNKLEKAIKKRDEYWRRKMDKAFSKTINFIVNSQHYTNKEHIVKGLNNMKNQQIN